jgi:hypothetical protein
MRFPFHITQDEVEDDEVEEGVNYNSLRRAKEYVLRPEER